jgi:chromate transporter
VAAASAAALWWGLNPFLVILGAAGLGQWLYRHRAPKVPPRPVARALGRGLASIAPLLAGLVAVLAVTFAVNRSLFKLAWLMLGINCVSFSAGFAALPIMYHQIVDVAGQMPARVFLDGIALGQITPGPIAITATFLGYMLFGLFGAVVATIAMFSPSFLILITVIPAFEALMGWRGFYRASLAIMASFVGMLGYATGMLAGEIAWSPGRAVLLAATVLALWRRIGIPFIVAGAAVYSLLLL